MNLSRMRILGVLLICNAAAAQVITTIAGTDFHFPTGPLTPANAPLGRITSVAVDASGNRYIVDQDNNLVFELTTNGALMVIAGNGIGGFSGDGGPATSASLYISDQANLRIRKVSNGIITTVAGNGISGFSGDGGPATSASLEPPWGLALDTAGSLYIADAASNRIRKVSNGTITTVAGNESYGSSADGGTATGASLSFPAGVSVDIAGSIYIADTLSNRVRKVSNGIITTVAGNGQEGVSGDGGAATSAALYFPGGVTVDLAGSIYIADTFNSRIRKVSNGIITTFAGSAPPTAAYGLEAEKFRSRSSSPVSWARTSIRFLASAITSTAARTACKAVRRS